MNELEIETLSQEYMYNVYAGESIQKKTLVQHDEHRDWQIGKSEK